MWWRPEHILYHLPPWHEPRFICPFCENYSPVIYDVGPICLRQGCCVFWVVGSATMLKLNNKFLLHVLAAQYPSTATPMLANTSSKKPDAYHCSECSSVTPQHVTYRTLPFKLINHCRHDWNCLVCNQCGKEGRLTIAWSRVSITKDVYYCAPDGCEYIYFWKHTFHSNFTTAFYWIRSAIKKSRRMKVIVSFTLAGSR